MSQSTNEPNSRLIGTLAIGSLMGFAMHLYEVLKRPLTTEKTNRLKDELRQYAFEVDMRATKPQIKEAVQLAFKVEVLNVNVMRMSRKRRHFGRRMIYKPPWKKAIITIPADKRIELFEGV